MVDKGAWDQCLEGISFPAGRDETAGYVTGAIAAHEVVIQLRDLQVGSLPLQGGAALPPAISASARRLPRAVKISELPKGVPLRAN
jgi:hypothetical protein